MNPLRALACFSLLTWTISGLAPLSVFANPDGPVRSMIFSGGLGRTHGLTQSDGMGSFQAMVAVPVHAFLTLRASAYAASFIDRVHEDEPLVDTGTYAGIGVRVFLPLTATSANYLRGKAQATANPDGPTWSIAFDLQVSGQEDSEYRPLFAIALPATPHLSFTGGMTRRRNPVMSRQDRSTTSDQWYDLGFRLFTPLTAPAQQWHRDMSSGSAANPDGAIGSVILSLQWASNGRTGQHHQYEVNVGVSAPLWKYATVHTRVARLTMVTGTGSSWQDAQRSSGTHIWAELSLYLGWSDARDRLARWTGR